MKTKKEIEEMIETLAKKGQYYLKRKNDIQAMVCVEKMGVLSWVLNHKTKNENKTIKG